MPEIVLPASQKSLGQALDFLHKHLGEDHRQMQTHVELAVEELLVNVASYAYGNVEEPKHAKHGQVVLGCNWVNMDGIRQFCVWLRDWGKPYNPFNYETPDTSLSVEERKLGGLGVHLIKHVSNHYVYCEADGSNTVELFFKP
ncbi:MAG: ATP-binding protein [Desulfovibrio sp.]|nr:ATP-binding protein [Desulfovibrio sp.]